MQTIVILKNVSRASQHPPKNGYAWVEIYEIASYDIDSIFLEIISEN
jgi:hypothetical protein